MQKMQLDLLPLSVISLLMFLFRSSTAMTRQQLLRYYVELVAVTQDDCHNQCQGKHGFFKDAKGEIQPTSVGESYYLKCKCMVSPELKEHIRGTLGDGALKSYQRYNSYWKTQWGRDMLHDYADRHGKDRIEFITFKRMLEFTDKKKKEELEGKLSAARQVELTRQVSESRKAAELNRQLVESKQEAAGLAAELGEKRNEMVQIHQNLQETRTDAAELRRQLSETRETVKRIEADSSSKLAQFQEQLNQSLEEARTLSAQLKERVTEVQELNKQLQESRKEAADLKRQLSGQQDQVARLNTQLNDARKEAAESKKKVEELTVKLNKGWWKSSCFGRTKTGSQAGKKTTAQKGKPEKKPGTQR